MKKAVFYVLVFYLGFSHAQNTVKKAFLYDENGNPIPMYVFKKKAKEDKYAYRLIENDTASIGVLALQNEVGKISAHQKNRLIEYLERITHTAIDTTQTIVLHFYFEPLEYCEKNCCIDALISDRTSRRYFRKNKKDIQFIFTQKGYQYLEGKTFEDEKDWIRKLFFKYKFGYDNYVIIKGNGAFFKSYRADKYDIIIDKLNEDW